MGRIECGIGCANIRVQKQQACIPMQFCAARLSFSPALDENRSTGLRKDLGRVQKASECSTSIPALQQGLHCKLITRTHTN